MAQAGVQFNMSFSGAKASFFTRRVITDRARKNLVKAMSRLGAFVWTRARTSLRYRKGASTPGEPPSAHKTASITRLKKVGGKMRRVGPPQPSSPLREFTFFWSEHGASWEGVLVGPTLLADRKGRAEALKALEYGGPSEVRTGTRVYRKINVAARPWMRPALAKGLKEMPKWLQKLLA